MKPNATTARTAAADRALAKLPKTIRISGFDFDITRLTAAEATTQQKYGAFSSLTQAIEIQWGMPSVHKLVDTFMHEICHGLFWVYGIGKEDSEERIVSMLGTALLALHRDNPWLSAWISSTLSTSYKDR